MKQLADVPTRLGDDAFELDTSKPFPSGLSARGIGECFSTTAPVSLYGSTKLASEILALEYGETFNFPVWIDRCGVLAGAGQFGNVEQGIFSYWVHAYAAKLPLKYIGFNGTGYQVRDAFHPDDLARLISMQIAQPLASGPRIFNVGGGLENSMSLSQLTAWCAQRFGLHDIQVDPAARRFDVPWLVMDYSKVAETFNWRPERALNNLLNDLAAHVHQNPNWIEDTGRT